MPFFRANMPFSLTTRTVVANVRLLTLRLRDAIEVFHNTSTASARRAARRYRSIDFPPSSPVLRPFSPEAGVRARQQRAALSVLAARRYAMPRGMRWWRSSGARHRR